MADEVLFSVRDRVAVITLNRPEYANAQNSAMTYALDAAFGRAFLVPRPGHALAEADVLAFCRERLANYKVPRRVVFRDALPRNPSGKVLKRVLREDEP